MKLYTLGTSHGATEENRSCSINLLEVEGSYYLFDSGGDAEAKIKNLGIDPGKVKAIFISHMHIDHVAGLPALSKRYLLHYNKNNNKADVFFPEERAIEPFFYWLDVTHYKFQSREPFDIKVIDAGVIYNDGTITVTAIPTKHIENGKFPSFAFMVETNNKRFLYTGDLSPSFDDFPKIVFEKNFDLILCELVHFDVEKNLPTISKAKTKKIIFTHVSLKKIPILLDNIASLPFSCEVAEDVSVYDI